MVEDLAYRQTAHPNRRAGEAEGIKYSELLGAATLLEMPLRSYRVA